jgi:cytochrome c-type biogenesis protein
MAARWQTFFHALAFVSGFSLVFVTLGASVAFFGAALNRYLPDFVKIGGAILILFGLQVSGALGWSAERVVAAGGERNVIGRGYIAFVDGLGRLLYTEGRIQARADQRLGYLSSVLMGVFFSAGWIPCVGPVLAAIYFLASDTQTVAQGALLLAVYSAGLGVPFLATGAAFSTMTGCLRKLNRYLGLVSKITGLFLIFVGVLLFMDRLALIANWFVARFGAGLASLELGADAGASVVTLPIALAAGLLSFLSPCVLPLIPAYIGYLSGTAVAGSPAGPARGQAG